MDTIIINDLEVFYRVGVADAERGQPQRLLLTIEMGGDFAAAALTDELAQTIDYCTVAERLRHFGAGRSWRLIEKVAVDVAELVRREFGAGTVSVEVKKFVLPGARFVGVRVTRPRPEGRAEGLF
jgi:dihydroneopterin aldolase